MDVCLAKNEDPKRKEITNILKNANIEKDYKLKFNPGPANLTHTEFINVKRDTINAVVEAECELTVSLLYHKLIKNSKYLLKLSRIYLF